MDVRGPGFDATLDLETGEVLAGWIPPKELRRVRRLLDQHRERWPNGADPSPRTLYAESKPKVPA